MKYRFTAAFVVMALFASAAILFALSGLYNISATEPHWATTLRFIQTLRDRSIKVHSGGIRVPDLQDPKLKKESFPHYHEMCRLCHGAPGYEAEEFARGLYPSPPSMVRGRIQARRSQAELYWILKNGIKMTGMPAFGPTHKEEELWGLVALADQIPRMGVEQYRQWVAEEERGHSHEHKQWQGEAEHGHKHDAGEEDTESR